MGKWVFGILLLIVYTVGIRAIITRRIYKKADEQYLQEYKRTIRLQAYYNTFAPWLDAKIAGVNIAGYFEDTDKIAVYGMGKIGRLLCKELLVNGKNVVCGIDQNISGIDWETQINVFSYNEELPEIDYIVISIAYLADDIVPLLESRGSYKIITIEEVLYAMRGGVK